MLSCRSLLTVGAEWKSIFFAPMRGWQSNWMVLSICQTLTLTDATAERTCSCSKTATWWCDSWPRMSVSDLMTFSTPSCEYWQTDGQSSPLTKKDLHQIDVSP